MTDSQNTTHTSADNRVLIERVITLLETHAEELRLLRQDVKVLTTELAEIRSGWKVGIGIGSALIALGAVLAAVWRRG